MTAVSVSLPAIQQALHASTSQLSWVSDAFILPMAALILTSGAVGDVFGRKKVFQVGLTFAGAGAVIALSAHSITILWAGQAIAGMGAAALLPSTLALISHAVPDHRERGKFVVLWAAALMAALAVGPMIAGLILNQVSWRWIYLPSIPAASLALLASVRLVADSRAPHAKRLDWPGQISAALAITSLVYGIIEGGANSFAEAEVIGALSLAAVSAVVFVLVERRSSSPILDLGLFRSPTFSATALIAMITFLGLIGFFFALSLYFGTVQHLGTLEAGYRLLLFSAVCLVVGAVVGRLMHRISAWTLIVTGLLTTAGSLLLLTTIDAGTSFGSIGWRLALLGLGLGLVITPMTATAVAAVPHHLAGMAAAGNNAIRQLGGALGPAVLGALLTARATSVLPGHLTDAGLDDQVVQHVGSVADAHGLGAVATMGLGADRPRVLIAVSQAFLEGVHLCLIVAAGLALIAAVVGVILLAPRTTKQARARETAALAAGDTPRQDGRTQLSAHSGAVLDVLPWSAGERSFARRNDHEGRRSPTTAPPQPAERLTGVIRKPDGSLVAGAALTLIDQRGNQVARSSSRGDGTYAMAAPDRGSYVLIVSANGYQPQASSVVVGGTRVPARLDITLTGASGVCGVIRSAQHGSPLARVVVTLTDERGDTTSACFTADDGVYSFEGINAGTYTLAAAGERLRPAAAAVTVPASGVLRHDVELLGAALLTGTARTEDDRLVPDVRVTVVDAAGQIAAVARTDGSGRYTVRDLPHGEYTVVVCGYPPATTTATVTRGEARHDVRLGYE